MSRRPEPYNRQKGKLSRHELHEAEIEAVKAIESERVLNFRSAWEESQDMNRLLRGELRDLRQAHHKLKYKYINLKVTCVLSFSMLGGSILMSLFLK